MSKINVYFKAIRSGDIAAMDNFLETNKVKPEDQKKALQIAIRENKFDVIHHLVNVRLDTKGRNLFAQQESHEALGWALARGRYQIAELLLANLNTIDEKNYRAIISGIKHNPSSSTTTASTLDELNRFIALLFNHRGLIKYANFHLDTFHILCVEQGLVHLYDRLSAEAFSISQQPQTIQLSILFSLMRSMHGLSLVQDIPDLDNLLKVNIHMVTGINENLLLIASKHNNVRMMQYLVSLEPSLLNLMTPSLDQLYNNHHHQKNILMATAENPRPAPQAMQWLLSNGLRDDGLLITVLTRNPRQIEMLEAYIANLPSEGMESLVDMSPETPCLLEHILLGQTSSPFESASLDKAKKNNIRVRAIYALANKLLEDVEDKHPSKIHLAARFFQTDDIPSTKFFMSPKKTLGSRPRSRSLGTIPSLLFNRQSLGTTHRRMTIAGPGNIDCYDRTPLHYFAMNIPYQILQLIQMNVASLDHHPHQAKLNQAVKKIEKAVLNDCYENYPLTALKHLLASGTPINAKDSYGNTALHLAAQYHDDDVVNYLCQAGAAVNEGNHAGMTPLMLACQHNRMVNFEEQRFGYAVINALLSHQADMQAEDDDGNNCYDYLNQRTLPNGEDIRALLDEHANNHQFNFA